MKRSGSVAGAISSVLSVASRFRFAARVWSDDIPPPRHPKIVSSCASVAPLPH